MAALRAGRDMPAKGGGAAVLDRGHHLQLQKVQTPSMVPAPGRPMGAEDIRDLQQMRGKAVPRGMGRHLFPDTCEVGRHPERPVELPGRGWIDRVAAREQPARRPGFAPVVAQQVEQAWRQHYMPILATFPLADPDQHPVAVDIADLQMRDLARPQPAAIGDAERTARYRSPGPGAASRRRATSPALSTTGIFFAARW